MERKSWLRWRCCESLGYPVSSFLSRALSLGWNRFDASKPLTHHSLSHSSSSHRRHLPSPPQYQIIASPSKCTTPLSFIDSFTAALILYHLQPHTFTSLVETSISHRTPSLPTDHSPLPSGPPLPIITLSPSSARFLRLWESIARSSPTGTSSSRRPVPEIISVNYSPSWRDTLSLSKDVGVAIAGLRKMQGLMREGEGRKEWVLDRKKGGEEEGEDVRVFRRDRWVVDRRGREDEGGESWFMDLKVEEQEEAGK